MSQSSGPGSDKNNDELRLLGLRFSITFNRDQTEAYLAIDEYPDPCDGETVLATLRKMVVERFPGTFNKEFLTRELQQLISRRLSFPGKLVAQGTPAREGKNAEVTFLVPRPSREFLIKPDGTVDFKIRDLFKSVAPDEMILVKHPSTPGIPGTTVTGEEIKPRSGKDIRVICGKNVYVEESDGDSIIKASCSGQVMADIGFSSINISVTPVLVVMGDVDYSTGNINFKGSVVVRGSILTGFSIIVTGNLTVGGMIEPGAKVTVGGDLVVEKGILGERIPDENSCEIRSFGNIQALYAENARVTAQGDIFLKSAMNCLLSANGALNIDKNIVGGSASAFKSVVAGEAGNVMGMETIISCGVSHSVIGKLNLIIKILKDLKRQLSEAEKNLIFLIKKGSLIPEEKRIPLNDNLRNKVKNLKEQVLKLELKKADLALILLEETKSNISARIFHPGVVIQIRSSRMNIDREYEKTTFYQQLPEETILPQAYFPNNKDKSPGVKPVR